VRDVFVDVTLEVPAREMRHPDAPQAVLERMRDSADRLCSERGARLRTDRAPEVIVKQAMHPLLGDMTLFASRWAAWRRSRWPREPAARPAPVEFRCRMRSPTPRPARRSGGCGGCTSRSPSAAS
jgi:hypothetical protein